MHVALARAATIAAGCAAGMTGCSGDKPRSSTLPPAPSSAPISAAPSSTPSPTEEQAVEAAVRFYYDGFNRAFGARDPDELARGSRPECDCRSAVDVVRRALSLGAVEGNRLSIESVDVTEIDGATATADVQYSTSPGRVVGPDGSVQATLKAERGARRGLALTRDGTG